MRLLLVRSAVAVVVVLGLAGCSAPQSEIAKDSTVAVAVAEPFTSYNVVTAFGSSDANANIVAATNGRFSAYDEAGTLVHDESFGTYEKLSDDPLTVKYTIGDATVWSDGVPVDAADLLLNWVALSASRNTSGYVVDDVLDRQTGEAVGGLPAGVVFFDSGQSPDRPTGLGLVTSLPEVSDDGASVTLIYDRPFVDWEVAMPGAGLPAHVIGIEALGATDADAGKKAVLSAIRDGDEQALSKIASFWNTGFVPGPAGNLDRLIGTGPYVIGAVGSDGGVTLLANENYAGDNPPGIGTVTVRVIPEPIAQVTALERGEVDVIAPKATTEVASALDALDGVAVIRSAGSTFEHLDLQVEQSKNGFFDNRAVREAFLATVPRRAMVEELVRPVRRETAVLDSWLIRPEAEGYAGITSSNGSSRYNEVDIDSARGLLADAGITGLEVCVLFAPDDARRVAEFELLQRSAALAGFDVTDCSTPDWESMLGTAGAYDAALFGWQSTGLGATATESVFRSDGANNHNFSGDPSIDGLLDEVAREFDEAEHAALQARLDEALWNEARGLPLFQHPAVIAHSDRVVNIRPSMVSPTLLWNVWEWAPTDGASGAR